ncbi:MAG: hypothetical protein ACOX5R_06550 [bacterium]
MTEKDVPGNGTRRHGSAAAIRSYGLSLCNHWTSSAVQIFPAQNKNSSHSHPI